MKFLQKLDGWLNKFEGWLLVVLLSAMVLLAFMQVVLRNVFSNGIPWVDILLRHLVLWIGFLGAALATSAERHINIDALTRFLPPRIKHLMAALTAVFAGTVCFFLTQASVVFIQGEIESHTQLFGDVETWHGELIIPVGFCLLMLHFLIRAVLSVGAGLKKQEAAQ